LRLTAANEAQAEEEEEIDDYGAKDDVQREFHERSILPK